MVNQRHKINNPNDQTKFQMLEFLVYIDEYLNQNRYAPSLRESSEYLSLSLGVIQSYVLFLSENGYLTFKKNDARTLATTPLGRIVIANDDIDYIQKKENR